VDDFFLDFIFEAVDAEEASRILKEEEEQLGASSEMDPSSRRKDSGNKATAVKASADDSMLHRDSRFWDVIATRMKEHAADNSEREEDAMWGPTVGRRRDFSGNDEEGREKGSKVALERERNALETFSIGGEFDFLPETVEPESQAQPPASSPPKPSVMPKKDSLMEALMGALDDDDDEVDGHDHEVVAFDTTAEKEHVATATASAGAEECATSDTGIQKEPLPESTGAAGNPKQEDDDMARLMAEATMNLDDDMDALFAGGGGLSDDDLLNLDVDDAELDDLENFLSASNQQS
jgi:hypothetical protein